MADHDNAAETPSTEGGDPHQGLPDKIRFDYIKSATFRIIHADGVVGGLSPRLDIQMNFWSERFPIPKQVVHVVEPDGTLGEEIKAQRSTREAVVREVDAGVVLDLETAKALQEWLQQRIVEAETILTERKKKEKRGRQK